MKKILLLTFAIFKLSNSLAVIWYVKPVASGTASGNSWANAMSSLQVAIIAADSGDQIWVAAGTYKPTAYPAGCTGCSTNRDFSFYLKNGVKMYGGFAGTETALTQRNIKTNVTILSGDIGTASIVTDNVYHVIVAVDVNFTAEINGFTVRDGNANVTGAVTIGGRSVGRNYGGGMANKYSGAVVADCLFTQNNSSADGGAIDNDNSTTFILKSIFHQNTAIRGGGISSFDSNPNITNCLLVGNSATNGGGVANSSSTTTILNCTIYGNSATTTGGGIYNISSSSPNINNTIVWGNTSSGTAGVSYSSSSPTITHSIIQGGFNPCTTCPTWNGDIDPQFVNTIDLNGLDNIWGTNDDGLRLYTCSPAIETANAAIYNPNNDITNQTRDFDVPLRVNPNYGVSGAASYRDIGAYENQSLTNQRLYVNGSLSTGANNGSSWANAFRGTAALHNALSTGSCEVAEIWVAAGTYKPSSYPLGCVGCSVNEDKTFLIKDGVKMYGGFAGTETNINQRIEGSNETILSGELGTPSNINDNAYHVLLSINNTLTQTLIDGFTIEQGGSNNNSGDIFINSIAIRRGYGGGLHNKGSNISIKKCKFLNNVAETGGGIYNNGGIPIISFSKFNNNIVGNSGGAIFNSNIPNTSEITFSEFSSNNAPSGGAIYNGSASPQIGFCTFLSNTAGIGGAVRNYNELSLPRYFSCVFTGNQANFGAAAANDNGTETNYTNCTFYQNNGGTSDFALKGFNSNTLVSNCIIWRTGGSVGLPAINNTGTSVTLVGNSIVEGGYAGCSTCPNTNGNINPQFVSETDLDGPDNIYQTFDDGLALRNISPAINAGLNFLPPIDYLSNNRVGNFDIGAFEFIPPNNCIANRHIVDALISSGTYRAYNKITATGTVGTGTNVIMQGGKSITLLPGFQTQNSAVFSTVIDECVTIFPLRKLIDK